MGRLLRKGSGAYAAQPGAHIALCSRREGGRAGAGELGQERTVRGVAARRFAVKTSALDSGGDKEEAGLNGGATLFTRKKGKDGRRGGVSPGHGIT